MTSLVSKGNVKLKPQWILSHNSFAKTKKVWRYTGQGWVHGATRASDPAHLWPHSSCWFFRLQEWWEGSCTKPPITQTWETEMQSYQNSNYPYCTFVFSPSYLTTDWIVFATPSRVAHPSLKGTPSRSIHLWMKKHVWDCVWQHFFHH